MKKLLLVSAICTASLFITTGCASLIHNGLTTLKAHSDGSEWGKVVDTTNYADKGLEQNYVVNTGDSILSYGYAKFDSYVNVKGHYPWQANLWKIPDGKHKLIGAYLDASMNNRGDNMTYWMESDTTDGKKIEKIGHALMFAGADDFHSIYLTHHVLYTQNVQFHEHPEDSANEFKRVKGLYEICTETEPTAIDLQGDSRKKPTMISQLFNPYLDITKEIIPSEIDNYRTLAYKGADGEELVFEYTETKGLKTGVAETIKVQKNETGNYSVKGVSFSLKNSTDGTILRLHSYFDGDTNDRFLDMLPFKPNLEMFTDELYKQIDFKK